MIVGRVKRKWGVLVILNDFCLRVNYVRVEFLIKRLDVVYYFVFVIIVFYLNGIIWFGNMGLWLCGV